MKLILSLCLLLGLLASSCHGRDVSREPIRPLASGQAHAWAMLAAQALE